MFNKIGIPNNLIKKLLTIIFLTSFVISLVPVTQVFAADPTPLAQKWVGYVGGGGESLLTYDVLSQYGGEEVFHAGGSVAPNSGGRVSCLNGRTGAQIWTRTITNVGDTCQIHMVDMDNNGDMEIVVPLQQPAGLYILHAENGVTMASFTSLGGGRIDSSPVSGDVDGDGYPDLFIGIMGWEEPSPSSGSNGKVIRYEWNPGTNSVVERDRVTVWHPCAGGLSLCDTDNDGRVELYMNERDVYFGDGSWGRGTVSFWADNLDVRWQLYGWGASSNIPMLADVNRDGVVDVVTTDLSRSVTVLNSTNGRPLANGAGTVLYGSGTGERRNHYQSSIYDFDGDGNIEIASADGFEASYNFVTVWDLWDWKLDGMIDTTIAGGRSWKGPTFGDVSGDARLEMLVVTFDHISNSNAGTLQVYDQNYELIHLNTGLRHRAIDAVVQDVDLNDGGLNEVLVLTQGGVIYCYESAGHASVPRARSEVQFYSEQRTGASQYIAFERPFADVSNPSPANGAVGVSQGLSSLTFRLDHPYGELMDYVVTSIPNIASAAVNNVGNGQRSIAVNGPLAANTHYRWTVAVTDDSGDVTVKDYSFTTGPYTPNSAPTQTTPSIAGATVLDDLVASAQGTSDADSDPVTNIYNWQKGGVSIANLYLPFNTKTDQQDEYSGLAKTRDYTYGASAAVFGATWIPDGRVGGAYSFNGNDFIRIAEPSSTSTRYDGNGNWGAVSAECWVKATANTNTERLIVKANLYDSDTSYRLDYRKTSTRLEFTWRVGTATGTYILGPYYVTTAVNDWHHIVATYKSGVGLKLFVDGVEVSSLLGPAYSGNVLNTNGPFEIAFGSGSDFAGLLDEVKLYPIEISPAMVNQNYLNTKDGLSGSSTLSRYDTQVNDQWRCQVTPNDGKVDGSTINTGTVTVGDITNTAPVASDLAITPVIPLSTDDLVASYNYFDANGHPEYNSIISWYKNGVFYATIPGLTLPAANTAKGESWTFRVTPYDGFDYGSVVTSDPVIIGNVAPSFTSLVILPNPAFDSSTLTANPSGYADADGDAEAYTYQWQKKVGDTYQDIVGATSQTLGTANFAPNDWIRVQVTAFDGTTSGNTLSFETQIVDSVEPSTGTPSLVAGSGSNRDDDELICTAINSQDPDGDNVINIYNWLRAGTSYTNLYLPFETNSLTIATDYSGYGNQGSVTGAVWTSQGITGGAYSFDGNDVITVGDSASLGNAGSWSEMTVEYWVNPSEDQRGARILNKNGGAAGTSGKFMTGINTDAAGPANVIFFGVTVGTSYQETYSNTASVVPTGSWSHVVGTYKSGEGIKLYINGVLQSSNPTVTGNIASSIGEPLLIGYASTTSGTANRYFKGLLDEVRVYPEALSAAQVFQNFIDQKDGVSDKVTIVPQETSSGQTWRCGVTPNDGWQDGASALSNQLTIVTGNTRPRIDWYSPSAAEIYVTVGESIDFMQVSSDPNGSPLTYSWTLDLVPQATTQNWTYTPVDDQEHTIRVTVSDGTTSDYQEWVVDAGIPSDQYTLTVNTVGSGSVAKNPDLASYTSGASVELTATPAGGYEFTGWSGALTGTTNPATITMDSDKTVIATFTLIPPTEYTLTVDVVGSGSVTKNPDQTTYATGTSVQLTAVPTTGHVFTGWSGDLTGTTNPATISVDSDKTVTATFALIPPTEYILTVNVVGSGSVEKVPDQTSYAADTVVDLTASSADGWSFAGWSGDASGTLLSTSVTMTADKTVTATFTENPPTTYTLTINIVGEGSVTKNPDATSYNTGTTVSLTATADSGYEFSGWSGDLTGTTNPQTITMDSNMVVTATFAEIPPTEYTLTVGTVGSGSVTKNPDQTSYVSGTSVQLTAVPATGYEFISWSGDLTGTTNPATITMDSNKAITATFTQIPPTQYTITVNIVGSGSVAKSPDTTSYASGTVVSLTATPATGYEFSGWGGDLTGTTNPQSITMDNDKIVTASFTAIPPTEYTLTVNTVGSGSVTRNPDQATYTAGASVQLTAVPASGYQFSAWSGDLSGITNPASITMDADKTITATFTATPPTTVWVSDDFESGTLNAWDGQDSGVSISTDSPYQGSYQMSGSVTSGGNNRWSGVNKAVDGINPIYLKAYVQFNAPPDTDNEDQWVLAVSQNAAGNALAYAGIRQVSGTLYWSMWYISAGNTLTYDISSLVYTPGWHTLELAVYRGTSNDGWVEFYVDGVLLCSAYNLDNDGRALNFARFGFSYSDAPSSASTTVYIDDVTIDDSSVQPTLFTIILQSQQDTSGINNLGSINCDGENFEVLPGSHDEEAGVGPVVYSAAPGYEFDHWETSGLISVSNGNSASTSMTVTGEGILTAVYSLTPPPVEYSLTVTTVSLGSVSKVPDETSYTSGTSVLLTATPAADYVFSGWSGDLTGTANPASITMDSNKEVTATFTQIPPNQYSLTVTIEGQGTVTKNPDASSYDSGTTVSLTATPATGYEFSGWSGDLTGTTNPASITMDSNKAVTATFTPIAPVEYTLTINIVGGGSVTKNPDQATYASGTSVQLTAVPNSGYEFSGWSGALSGTTNPATITMDGDKTVTATFVEIPSGHLFEDNFESGNLEAWDGQESTATISTINPFQGTYHLSSSLSSGANNGWSGLYKSVEGTNPVYLSADVLFNAPPNTDNEDQWALALTQSTAGNALAYAGIRQVSGTLYWTIWYISSGTTLTYAVSDTVYTPGWHNLELAVSRGTDNDGWVEFYVDGVLTCSAYNLDNDGRALNYARVGFSYSDAPSSAASSLFIDNVTIDAISG